MYVSNCSKLSYWRGLYLCTIRGIKGVPGYLAAVVSLTLRSLIKALTFTLHQIKLSDNNYEKEGGHMPNKMSSLIFFLQWTHAHIHTYLYFILGKCKIKSTT